MYRILCLNGGGIRGALQVGALKHVDLNFPDGIYGISIGAILGSLIAFQFSIQEIEAFTLALRLDEMLDLRFCIPLDTAQQIHIHLSKLFSTKGLCFDDLRIGDAHMPLYVIASDMTRLKIVIFGEHVALWDALRSSFSLPLLFAPHRLDGREFVDGAVLCRNIVKLVPKCDRHLVLALLTNTTLEGFQKMLHGVSAMEILKMRKKYPRNVCVLQNSTGMLDADADMKSLIETGAQCMKEWNTLCK